MHSVCVVAGVFWCIFAGQGNAQEMPANDTTERWLKGQYTYRTIPEHRIRGTEDWSLTVHADGTRTMVASVDNIDAGVRFQLVHRVDAVFKPIEVFVSHWVRGESRGTSHVTVEGDELKATIRGPAGHAVQTLKVGDTFSVQPHPVSTDGWRGSFYDHEKGGEQISTNFNISVAPDSTSPLLGMMQEETVEFIGNERITVPAGTFDTAHYKFRGVADIWVDPKDRVVIRYAYFNLNREYTLTAFSSGP